MAAVEYLVCHQIRHVQRNEPLRLPRLLQRPLCSHPPPSSSTADLIRGLLSPSLSSADSSFSVSSAMANLIAAFTFLFAVIFSVVGAIVIVGGFYGVIWAKSQEMEADEVEVSSGAAEVEGFITCATSGQRSTITWADWALVKRGWPLPFAQSSRLDDDCSIWPSMCDYMGSVGREPTNNIELMLGWMTGHVSQEMDQTKLFACYSMTIGL
ncbi:hypothetical protein CRG98_022651 [Punica granatum]|uniref:Uncharacterized protein n=1 Tax=Punica granatum TaxID=22663 RepID=A0A2I0JL74_PUNGR|nr:hypothetical protein CRG98_022651 [Punica granatum]